MSTEILEPMLYIALPGIMIGIVWAFIEWIG